MRLKGTFMQRASSFAVSVFATPGDVKKVLPAVLRHRIMLTPEKEMEGGTPDEVIDTVVKKIEVPR